MAKIKNYDGRTGMELSYVAVQATRPKKKTVDWVGITETFIVGGMWVIVFMMLGAALVVQVLLWLCGKTSAVLASRRIGVWKEAAYRHAEIT